jgi:hypothetical protein
MVIAGARTGTVLGQSYIGVRPQLIARCRNGSETAVVAAGTGQAGAYPKHGGMLGSEQGGSDAL